MSANPGTPRAVLDHVGHIAPQKGWGMVEHVHPDFHEFILVLHGELQTRIRGVLLHGKRGDLLLYPAREPHAEQAVGDEPLETLFVGWQGLDAPAVLAGGVPLLVNDRSGRARMLLQWMRELSLPGQAADDRKAAVLLEALVYEYQQLAQPPEQSIIGQVKTYIQHHLAEPITLEDLAGVAGFSRYHFSREFKRLSGMTPMAFLRQERVEAARSLLLSTPWTLQMIAEQVGFADETQLSRVFHRLTGKPPGQWRR